MIVGQIARKMLKMALRVPAIRPVARRLRSGSVAIVMYHGVVATPMPYYDWCQLSVVEFEAQLQFLAQEYQILPLSEVVDRLTRRRSLPARTACLTFDDGFRGVGRLASPIMEKYQAPSTVFLVTSLVGTDQPAWADWLLHAMHHAGCDAIRFEGRDWLLSTPEQCRATYAAVVQRLKQIAVDDKDRELGELTKQLGPFQVDADSSVATLNWTEVEQLAATGLVEFGSHTHTHPILSRCPAEMQREELSVSHRILMDRLGKADLFAYPNGGRGDFTDATKRILEDIGYRCGVSTIPGLNRPQADLYELRRVNVASDTSLRQFELLMLGL